MIFRKRKRDERYWGELMMGLRNKYRKDQIPERCAQSSQEAVENGGSELGFSFRPPEGGNPVSEE